MSRPHLARSLPAVLAVAVLGLGACGADDETSSSPSSAPESSSSSPTSTPVAEDPALVPRDSPVSVSSCSPRSRRGDVDASWGPVLIATGDVRVTGVSLVGDGLRLLGVDAVLTSVPDGQGDTGFDDRWPTDDRGLPDSAELAGRAALEGFAVPAGRQVLPIVGVRIQQDPATAARPALRGLEVTWTWGDGSQEDSVVLPLDRSFAAGPC